MFSQIVYMLDQVKEMVKVGLDVIELGIIYFLRMSLVIIMLVAILLAPGSEEIYHNNIFATWWTILHYGIFTVVTDLFYHCDEGSLARSVFFVLFGAPLMLIVKYDASMVIPLLLC
jgi:hypothetical protein